MKYTSFDFYLLAHAHHRNVYMNANLFPVKYLRNKVITIFNFKTCPPTGPSFPLAYVVSIYHISIQNTGFAGSRGGEHTFISSPEPLGSQGELIVYPCSGVRTSSSVRPQFQTSSPLKPLGQSKPNFMWSLFGKG